MAIRVPCPACQAGYTVPDRTAGRTIPCPACRADIPVPAEAGRPRSAGTEPPPLPSARREPELPVAEFAPPDPADRSPARRGRGPARRWVLLAGAAATVCLACCGGLGVWVAVKGRPPAAADLPVLPRRVPATLPEAIDRIEAATDHKLIGQPVQPTERMFGNRPYADLFYDTDPGGRLGALDYGGLVVECHDERDAEFLLRTYLPPGKNYQEAARRRMFVAGRFLIMVAPEDEARKVRRAFGR